MLRTTKFELLSARGFCLWTLLMIMTLSARDPARRFAIAGVVLASTLARTGLASAAEMPKELWGQWCEAELAAFTKCKPEERVRFDVRRKSIGILGGEEGTTCYPVKIRKEIVKGGIAWVVRGKCYGEGGPEYNIFRYTRRGVYLYFK